MGKKAGEKTKPEKTKPEKTKPEKPKLPADAGAASLSMACLQCGVMLA